MQYEMNLPRSLFTQLETEILHSEQWSVTTKTYSSGVASLTIRNSLGYVEVLPFMGKLSGTQSFAVTACVWKTCFQSLNRRP